MFLPSLGDCNNAPCIFRQGGLRVSMAAVERAMCGLGDGVDPAAVCRSLSGSDGFYISEGALGAGLTRAGLSPRQALLVHHRLFQVLIYQRCSAHRRSSQFGPLMGPSSEPRVVEFESKTGTQPLACDVFVFIAGSRSLRRAPCPPLSWCKLWRRRMEQMWAAPLQPTC